MNFDPTLYIGKIPIFNECTVLLGFLLICSDPADNQAEKYNPVS